MRNWHSFYEILRFPISLLYIALLLLGLGNALSNPAFSTLYSVENSGTLALAEVLTRTGSFLLTNFPLFCLIRLVTRKAGSATSITSAIAGYIAYLAVLMCFTVQSVPSINTTAFSSILGLSTSNANVVGSGGGVRYPLQTGQVATLIISIITLGCFRRSRRHSEYAFLGFISKDALCVVQTIFWCALAGFVVAIIWPAVLQGLNSQITFIAADTTNPVNLMFYGILDRIMNLLGLSTLIRSPFWYGASGGSWISVAGVNVAGDVNIWTAQLSASALTGSAGRFITPYYVLNLFAMPGLLWGAYSIQTDAFERRRTRGFYILATLLSLFSGSLLPLELTLLFLCPLLYVLHLCYTGVLYGILHVLKIYLGFNYTGTNTIAVLPGTLLEYLTYLNNPSLRRTLLGILAVGAVTFLVYYLTTRLYFYHLAVDVFHTGQKNELIQHTIEAVGGVENIKNMEASPFRLVISLYDPAKLNARQITDLGSLRVYETKAGYAITFGAASTMIRQGILNEMRSQIRSV